MNTTDFGYGKVQCRDICERPAPVTVSVAAGVLREPGVLLTECGLSVASPRFDKSAGGLEFREKVVGKRDGNPAKQLSVDRAFP